MGHVLAVVDMEMLEVGLIEGTQGHMRRPVLCLKPFVSSGMKGINKASCFFDILLLLRQASILPSRSITKEHLPSS